MTYSLEDRVALVTGGARGQGRSHAIEMAAAGAKVVVVDICGPIPTVPYPLGTKDELDETVRLIRDEGGDAAGVVADVRSLSQMQAAAREAVDAYGRLDIVIANAGVAQGFVEEDLPPEAIWADYLAVNLTGAWNTIQATQSALIAGGRGGSIVLINSTSGLKGMSRGDPRSDAYTAAKHGLVGLMKAYATELGPYQIRVNSVHPTAVDTPMIRNSAMEAWIDRNVSRVATGFRDAMNAGTLAPKDISDAVLWLVSDAARFVTGVALPVDAGFLLL